LLLGQSRDQNGVSRSDPVGLEDLGSFGDQFGQAEALVNVRDASTGFGCDRSLSFSETRSESARPQDGPGFPIHNTQTDRYCGKR
jgi:hypothetical protein